MNHKKHTLEIGRMKKNYMAKGPVYHMGAFVYIFAIEETRDFLLIGNHPINCTFHAI